MKTEDITVKMIYRNVAMCNSTYSTITNDYNDGNTNEVKGSIMGFLPERSLAYKIIKDMKHTLSVKQTWVVAYELMKSEEYKQSLITYYEDMYGEGVDVEDLPSYEI